MSLAENNIDETAKLKYLAAVASIATAFLLLNVKMLAVFLTGSLSITSSMIDSLSDMVSSLITFIAVRYSDKPLTSQHRYGYGKAESVSALFQAAFIMCSAGFILYDAIYRFLHPIAIKQAELGINIMLVCILFTLLLIGLQKYVVYRTKSRAISADSLHYVVDLLSNGSVVLSLVVVKYFNMEWADILVAVLIAVYLLYNAVILARSSLEELTDKELDENIKRDIIKIALSVKGVRGYHDFRSRVSGSRVFVEIHIEIDGFLTLYKTHDIAEAVENNIIAQYPHAQVIVHQDPYGIEEKHLDADIVE